MDIKSWIMCGWIFTQIEVNKGKRKLYMYRPEHYIFDLPVGKALVNNKNLKVFLKMIKSRPDLHVYVATPIFFIGLYFF